MKASGIDEDEYCKCKPEWIFGVDDSNELPGPFGFEVHARDALAVIDYLGLEKICKMV